MKIIVRPEYRSLSDFIEGIPSGRFSPAVTFCNHRNTVQKVCAGEYDLVIKRYKPPTWANRVVYTLFRPSKARRSYEYALRLQESGIGTPDPVAYIEIRKYGFFHTGYFVSRYIDYVPLAHLERYDEPQQKEILEAFAAFTCRLHTQGIRHDDYSSSNIMFRKEPDDCRFALIDINRMRFGKLSRRDCIRNFRRLGLTLSKQLYVICRYSTLRHWQEEWCVIAVLVHRRIVNAFYKFKHLLKNLVKGDRHRHWYA